MKVRIVTGHRGVYRWRLFVLLRNGCAFSRSSSSLLLSVGDLFRWCIHDKSFPALVEFTIGRRCCE